jgi:hypothetical protein
MIIFTSIAIIFASILCIVLCGNRLAQKHDNDIRVIFYFFSLSLVISMIIIIWAVNSGAISNKGDFSGDIGQYLDKLLKFMLDLKTDVLSMAAIFIIITIPQAISYILSGLFGCASNPKYISASFSFLIWGVVKSLITGAGILFSLILSGFIFSWNWQPNSLWSLFFTVSSLIGCSFLVLWMYRDSQNTHFDNDKKSTNIASTIHSWFTRNLTKN